jgi:hypothetical protein
LPAFSDNLRLSKVLASACPTKRSYLAYRISPILRGSLYCFEPFTSSIDAVAIICGLATSIRQFALPLAVFAIVFIGFQLVIAASGGNEGKLAQTKSWLLYVVIGTVIIAAATTLVNAAVRFSAQIGGGPVPQACQ